MPPHPPTGSPQFFAANGLLVIFPMWNSAIVRNRHEWCGWRFNEDIAAFSGRRQPSDTTQRDDA